MLKKQPLSIIPATFDFYAHSYKDQGFLAQRRYPNEELCRFTGRNFSHPSIEDKANCKVLETGCGSGANLWMLAREGFDTYGLDFSPPSVELAQQMLHSYSCKAHLKIGDMCHLDYPNNFFVQL